MSHTFNLEKSLQAAGVLLELEDGRMPYLRLLKLLYIADREMLATTAAPVTGDRVYAMQYGPVLSHVYSLIKGEASQSGWWSQFIEKQGYAAKMRRDPGRGKLSKDEIAKLTDVSQRYRDKDQWEISDLTHDFPEWAKHYPAGSVGGSYPIPWQDVLEAQGKTELVGAVEENAAARRLMDELFGS